MVIPFGSGTATGAGSGHDAGGARAAVFGQEDDQVVDRRVVGRIENEASRRPRLHESGMAQFFEMEGQRRGRNAQAFADLAGGQTIGTLLDQQAEHGQARFLGQRGKEGDCGFVFHASTIMEIWKFVEATMEIRCHSADRVDFDGAPQRGASTSISIKVQNDCLAVKRIQAK